MGVRVSLGSPKDNDMPSDVWGYNGDDVQIDDLVLRKNNAGNQLYKVYKLIHLTVQLPEGDDVIDALKRADRALADEGLTITGINAHMQ